MPLVERHVFTLHLYFVVSHLLNVKRHGCVIIHARAKNESCLSYKNKEHLFTLFCFILNICDLPQDLEYKVNYGSFIMDLYGLLAI